MKRPHREQTQSDDIDADYMEFMRRMYEHEEPQYRNNLGKIFLLAAGIAACIAIIIYQLS